LTSLLAARWGHLGRGWRSTAAQAKRVSCMPRRGALLLSGRGR
jgi:hypothetical protein